MSVLRIVQITVVLLSLALIGPALSVVASTTADPQLNGATDAAEITAMILKNQAHFEPRQPTGQGRHLEGWFGRVLVKRRSSAARQERHVTPRLRESLNIMAKDIEVATVVPGQAAVATYYAEGSLQAKGAAAVSNYLTRVTLVFVKERRGEWKRRAAHWSPIVGGAGTTQTVQPARRTDESITKRTDPHRLWLYGRRRCVILGGASTDGPESLSREPPHFNSDPKNQDLNRRQRITLIITLASAALTGPAWSVIASITEPPTSSVTSVENRVREVLLQHFAFSQKNTRSMQEIISEDGSVEFWSSGGLRHHVPAEPSSRVVSTNTPRLRCPEDDS